MCCQHNHPKHLTFDTKSARQTDAAAWRWETLVRSSTMAGKTVNQHPWNGEQNARRPYNPSYIERGKPKSERFWAYHLLRPRKSPPSRTIAGKTQRSSHTRKVRDFGSIPNWQSPKVHQFLYDQLGRLEALWSDLKAYRSGTPNTIASCRRCGVGAAARLRRRHSWALVAI